MYFVKYGDVYLHDPRVDGYTLVDLSLDTEENSCGYCDFTIYPDHPNYGILQERDTNNPVNVYDGDVLLFSGFIYELGTEFYLDGHVKCKGELAYLSESIIRPYSTLERGFGTQAPSSCDGYFEWLIQQHNEQVTDNKRFKVGINQAADLDNNNYLYRQNDNYPNTLSEIMDKLIGNDGIGGYLRIRHEDGERYIDYLSEWTDTNSQILDFGVNLTEYTQTDNSDDIATFVIPLGARMSETEYNYDHGYYKTEDLVRDQTKEYYTYDSQTGQMNRLADNVTVFTKGVTYYEYLADWDESNNSLTIEGIEDADYVEGYGKTGDMVYSREAVNKYGWIGYTITDQDITIKENLVAKGILALKELESPKRTIEIKAVDMHLINPSIKPIRIGEYVRVRSGPHNLDSYFLCRSINLDLDKPENSFYTLGTTYDTLTGEQNKRINKLNASINKQYEEASKLSEEAKAIAQKTSDKLENIDVIEGPPGPQGEAGKSQYLHIAYANSPDGSEDFTLSSASQSEVMLMAIDDSDTSSTQVNDMRYIGQYTSFEKEPSTDPESYAWSTFRGEDGQNGDDGISVVGVTTLYMCTNTETTPHKPTAHITLNSTSVYSVWNKTVAKWTSTNKYYYTCDETELSDGTYTWSDVSRNMALEEANRLSAEAKGVANGSSQAAGEAKHIANEAAKVATNYMQFQDETGLVVGDMTSQTLGKNSLIDANGFAVRDNTTEMARFGADQSFIGTYDSSAFKVGDETLFSFFKEKNNGEALTNIKTKLATAPIVYGAEDVEEYRMTKTDISTNGNVSLYGEGGSGIYAGIDYVARYETVDDYVISHLSFVDLRLRDAYDTDIIYTPISIRTDFSYMGMGSGTFIKPYVNIAGHTVIIRTQQQRNAKIDYVIDNLELAYGQSYNFYPVSNVTYLAITKEYNPTTNKIIGQYMRIYTADELGNINQQSVAGSGGGITFTIKNDTTNKKPYVIFKAGSSDSSSGTTVTTKANVLLTIKKIDSFGGYGNYLKEDAGFRNYYYDGYGSDGNSIMDAYGNRNDGKTE